MSLALPSKALHVLATARAAGAAKHPCAWPGCKTAIAAAMWGCRFHWIRLPARIRNRIWKAYQPGQEVTIAPTREYLDAAKEAQEWIGRHGRG